MNNKMAEKKESSKIVLERTYVIPLRQELLKVPFYRKAEKAVSSVRKFAQKHMKSKNVLLGTQLNLYLWRHGMKNPPGKVKVTVTKDDKGKVFVELFGAKKIAKEEKKTTKSKGKVKDAEFKEVEQKIEVAKEEKAEEAKKVETEEIKEMQKEQKEHPSKQHAPKEPKMAKQIPQNQVAPKHL